MNIKSLNTIWKDIEVSLKEASIDDSIIALCKDTSYTMVGLITSEIRTAAREQITIETFARMIQSWSKCSELYFMKQFDVEEYNNLIKEFQNNARNND